MLFVVAMAVVANSDGKRQHRRNPQLPMHSANRTKQNENKKRHFISINPYSARSTCHAPHKSIRPTVFGCRLQHDLWAENSEIMCLKIASKSKGNKRPNGNAFRCFYTVTKCSFGTRCHLAGGKRRHEIRMQQQHNSLMLATDSLIHRLIQYR